MTTPNADPVVWIEEPSDCPVCGASAHVRLGQRGGVAHRAGLGTSTTVVRCRSCHLVYCRPSLRPVGNPYSAYEGDEYFAGHMPEAKLENARRLIQKAEQLRGCKGSLLELGCGRGELLSVAAQAGWRVAGVEMTPQFAQEARQRGVEIELASVEGSELLNKVAEFDVIYLAAILEHLYEPMACLGRIRKALKPGGIVFIDVPNECSLRTKIGNLYMRLRGRDWAVNLSPTFQPFHVVGFCEVSLTRALLSSGLEIADLQVVRWPDVLPPREGFWGIAEGAASRGVNRFSELLGDGDGIVCWARRPD